ncbi:MAG: hypothetical protein KBC64_03440 [Simkaniaceae bacterium]|nr:hypothetical protein [Simkaniaceae bacterium]
MTAIYHPYVNENFTKLLPRAESDLAWKKIAYKVSEWSLWFLAGATVLGLIVTATLFPHIITPDLALTLAPCLTLVFALSETRKMWYSNIVTPRYHLFTKAQAKQEELAALAQKRAPLKTLSTEQLKRKISSFGLDPNSARIDRSLIARYELYAEKAHHAQQEANVLLMDPSQEANYYKGYAKEEMFALANKVYAAAMLHLMKHPNDTRSLEELAPITPQRYDERARLHGVPFGGDYLPGISRREIRFNSISQIANRLFGS